MVTHSGSCLSVEHLQSFSEGDSDRRHNLSLVTRQMGVKQGAASVAHAVATRQMSPVLVYVSAVSVGAGGGAARRGWAGNGEICVWTISTSV